MNKENIIRRIKENLEDIEAALDENGSFTMIPLFRVYTDEILKIIDEECN